MLARIARRFSTSKILQIASSSIGEVDQIFRQHEIVPQVVPTAPQKFLKITYGYDLMADKGCELTPTQVKDAPTVEWDGQSDALYTLVMTDPDAPTRSDPIYGEMKHWLVVNIPGNALGEGDIIADYRGSGAPKGTGLHRYIFLLYKQQTKLDIDEPRVAKNSRQNRPKFRVANFAKKFGLGDPLAGNFFQAQWDEYVEIFRQETID